MFYRPQHVMNFAEMSQEIMVQRSQQVKFEIPVRRIEEERQRELAESAEQERQWQQQQQLEGILGN